MNPAFPAWILLGNAAATLMMAGLIWQVQLVHYPLFAHVGREGFSAYEYAHTSRITLVVGPLMLVETVTAGLLLLYRPAGIGMGVAVAGVALVCLIWFSTWFLQVPQHNLLTAGFDVEAHRILVATNWLRTAAWSLRGALVLWMIAGTMS
ncbi:MAG: hypothetical protein ACKV2V_22110 [Blastocatellia bacterium]